MNSFLIFGFGVSGKAAAKLIGQKHKNPTIYAVDQNEISVKGIKQVSPEEADGLGFQTAIISPGYQLSKTEKAILKGKTQYTEYEFGFLYLKPHLTIGVTGTNGKSTVVKMLEWALSKSGKNVVVGGNIGIPICELALQHSTNQLAKNNLVVVTEISSYQLHYTQSFMFDWGIITNITPDHLAWHSSLQNYIGAKLKLSLIHI